MLQSHPAHMPKVIAHRGASGTRPENTLIALERAAQLGARAVEIDVTVSRDDVAVIVHDFTVDRCSDGHGPVALLSEAELRVLDAGSWFAPEFAGQHIPRLDEALEVIRDHELELNLELKPTLGLEENTAQAAAETLGRVWPKEAHILVSSMCPVTLDAFHDLMPQTSLALITDAIPDNWLSRLRKHHCSALHPNALFVTEQGVADLHEAGYRVHAFTVNEEDDARRLFDMGVDAIFTDYPERMLDL